MFSHEINFILSYLIFQGEYIDATLGAALGISTMAGKYCCTNTPHMLAETLECYLAPSLQTVYMLTIEISGKLVLLWVRQDDQIRSQFCTCHDSWPVVTCANLWPNWMIRIITKVKWFFQLSASNLFVEWTLGLQCVYEPWAPDLLHMYMNHGAFSLSKHRKILWDVVSHF